MGIQGNERNEPEGRSVSSGGVNRETDGKF